MPKLKRYAALLKEIPEAEKPAEVRGILCTKNNLKRIESYLQARDKLIIWQKVAQSLFINDTPNMEKLDTLEAFVNKASEFNDWIDTYPAAQAIIKLEVLGQPTPSDLSKMETIRRLSSIPVEIGRFTQLQELSFIGHQISKIENLENLKMLQELDLSENLINKIENLENLSKLQMLGLHSNQIGEIEGLQNQVELQMLSLHDNLISKIEGLDQLTQLEALSLQGNQISKVENLENLTMLQDLSLEGNPIDPSEMTQFSGGGSFF